MEEKMTSITPTISLYAMPGIPALRTLSIKSIEEVVCDVSGVPHDVARKKTRKREAVFVRQLVFYFAAKYHESMPANENSLSAIGRYYGKNHATVVYARKTIDGFICTNRVIRQQCSTIDGLIKSSFLTDLC